MISNIIRVIIAGGIFTLAGFFLRDSIITDSQINHAKKELGVKKEAELYILENTKNLSHSHDENTAFLSASKLRFLYNPNEIEKNTAKLTSTLSNIILSPIIEPRITKLDVILNRDFYDVRGKMKAGAVLLYNVESINQDELIGVFIHELAHHIDIYSLSKKVFRDPSEDFYDISWENTTNMKGGQRIKDFVSGYAMSNKYEDFAESLTYYVFANEEMRQRSKDSFAMKQKYEFFEKNIFTDSGFKQTDFSAGDQKRYYWDITKKGFDIEKFLQYLENEI